jgi:hypothetical protein
MTWMSTNEKDPMSHSSHPVDGMLITCIIPEGKGHELMKKLIEEKGINTASLHHARGSGHVGGLRRRGFIAQIKKDVVTAAVSDDRADEIFSYMFFEGDINQPHTGIIYMERLDHFAPIVPMETELTPDEDEGDPDESGESFDSAVRPI